MEGVEIVRSPRARSLRLTLDPTTGRARLVLPRRAALKTAIAWAEGKQDWLAAQRATLPQPVPFMPGTLLSVGDARLTIAWAEGRRRTVVREGDTLSLEGPIETVPRRVEAWLKRAALDALTEDTRHYAALAGVSVARVAIGDARGRWGSCAASGAIRYSWRLILAPSWVRRATAAHEVAHRVHMNHGAAFHALVATLYGADPTPARAWLRRHGAALHWVGRSS
ncbi:M48 family metallopeptidase [Sphingomonas sp.]|jgi:hypothetical protein|uniref:M48 family metallopeptidase n=1 Tax=Sphingomonas sp. TaxID=28214 RepID=UPI0039C9DEA6